MGVSLTDLAVWRIVFALVALLLVIIFTGMRHIEWHYAIPMVLLCLAILIS